MCSNRSSVYSACSRPILSDPLLEVFLPAFRCLSAPHQHPPGVHAVWVTHTLTHTHTRTHTHTHTHKAEELRGELARDGYSLHASAQVGVRVRVLRGVRASWCRECWCRCAKAACQAQRAQHRGRKRARDGLHRARHLACFSRHGAICWLVMSMPQCRLTRPLHAHIRPASTSWLDTIRPLRYRF